MTLKKNDLVDSINEHLDVNKVKGLSIVDSTFEIIKEELEKGNKVVVSGFGKWTVREKRPRRGRNPQTGAEIRIAGRKVVSFKHSALLKEKINQED